MKMNGWQRVWVVASVCWASFWLYRVAETIWKFGFSDQDFIYVVSVLLGIVVIPPAALYVAVVILLFIYRWVAIGFRS